MGASNHSCALSMALDTLNDTGTSRPMVESLSRLSPARASRPLPDFGNFPRSTVRFDLMQLRTLIFDTITGFRPACPVRCVSTPQAES